MARAASRWPPHPETRALSQAIPREVIVSKVARGYDFLRVFRCTPVNIISPVLHTYLCIINSIQYQQFTAS